MEITEIRVFPKSGPDKKLKAYVTITFDHAFVVRNIKVIQGLNALFIAMPSKKIKYSCKKCGAKNEVGSKYCQQCAAQIDLKHLEEEPIDAKAEHRDIAHPITQQFRDYLQIEILKAYDKEMASPSGLIK